MACYIAHHTTQLVCEFGLTPTQPFARNKRVSVNALLGLQTPVLRGMHHLSPSVTRRHKVHPLLRDREPPGRADVPRGRLPPAPRRLHDHTTETPPPRRSSEPPRLLLAAIGRTSGTHGCLQSSAIPRGTAVGTSCEDNSTTFTTPATSHHRDSTAGFGTPTTGLCQGRPSSGGPPEPYGCLIAVPPSRAELRSGLG